MIPTTSPADSNLKNIPYHDLLDLVVAYGQKPFTAKYLFTFIHSKNANTVNDISPLSKPFRKQLIDDGYFISQIKPAEQHEDPDGTVKFVFEMDDGARIESVLLKDGQRSTLCISTQAGCRMGCKFCATGQLRFQRNLTAAEIVDQVYHAERTCGKIDNVVYMGMGEPLDNYENVIRSVGMLNSPDGRNIGIRHMTVSTCGLPVEIRRLAMETLQPRLALSLHAPNDAIRSKIMRVATTYSMNVVMTALKSYQSITNKRITVEYCMIDGVNDKIEHAVSLVKLLRPLKVNVNLIELNPFPGCPYKASSPEQIQRFAKTLVSSGIETIVRFKRGRSIKAACGQLGATWLKGNE